MGKYMHSERVSNLLKVTQLVYGRAAIEPKCVPPQHFLKLCIAAHPAHPLLQDWEVLEE
jgi:hypothetical protein